MGNKTKEKKEYLVCRDHLYILMINIWVENTPLEDCLGTSPYLGSSHKSCGTS